MDSLTTVAARALAAGDSLAAFKHVALRKDPTALLLHGIAMAQLDECPRALAEARPGGYHSARCAGRPWRRIPCPY